MVSRNREDFEMKKINLYILIILFVILVFLLFMYSNSNKNQACFSQNCFKIEVVSTPEELSKGLMFRESLEKNSGMLFIFPKEDLELNAGTAEKIGLGIGEEVEFKLKD